MTARDRLIFNNLDAHWKESHEHFADAQIVGLFLQGSQNYNLDLPGSDTDTKLIVAPSFRDIALNKKPVSTTHIRENNEHIDFKDIRLYMDCFYKQNLNFLEILFTPYFIVNGQYFDEWNRLVEARESIARMNEYRAVKSMKGIAMEKFHAMEHPYPSKVDVLAKYGYDPKQLHHLCRVDEYLTRYIAGESYEKCLIPESVSRAFLLNIKQGDYNLEQAREMAQNTIEHVTQIADDFCSKREDKENAEMRELLQDVQYNIMKIAVEEELKR